MSEPETQAALNERMAAMRAARKPQTPDAPATQPAPGPAAEVGPVTVAPIAPTTMEKAAMTEEAARAKKVAALRAAKLAGADPATDPLVKVRITKKGHGLVSMGEHINGLGDLAYDHGETPDLPQTIAQELEDRGFVEIQ